MITDQRRLASPNNNTDKMELKALALYQLSYIQRFLDDGTRTRDLFIISDNLQQATRA